MSYYIYVDMLSKLGKIYNRYSFFFDIIFNITLIIHVPFFFWSELYMYLNFKSFVEFFFFGPESFVELD